MGIHWRIVGNRSTELMVFFRVGFEMGFQEAQRIDPYAAALTDGSPLLGLAHGNFLEHGSD